MNKSLVCIGLVFLILNSLMLNSNGLQCYSCLGCGSSLGTLVTCASYETSCYKSNSNLGILSSTSRGCDSSCVESGANFVVVGGSRYCCKTDACNSSTKMITNKFLATFSTLTCLFFALFKSSF